MEENTDRWKKIQTDGRKYRQMEENTDRQTVSSRVGSTSL
jgi:hypothetical protein